MEEAKYSLNIKFRWQGFECQFTSRSDENGGQTLIKGKQIIETLLAQGAVPNGNHQASLTFKGEEKKRVCPVCGQDDELELIKFERGGKPHQAYKCQRCSKWLPDEK